MRVIYLLGLHAAPKRDLLHSQPFDNCFAGNENSIQFLHANLFSSMFEHVYSTPYHYRTGIQYVMKTVPEFISPRLCALALTVFGPFTSNSRNTDTRSCQSLSPVISDVAHESGYTPAYLHSRSIASALPELAMYGTLVTGCNTHSSSNPEIIDNQLREQALYFGNLIINILAAAFLLSLPYKDTTMCVFRNWPYG